jgi:hypothetical protein
MRLEILDKLDSITVFTINTIINNTDNRLKNIDIVKHIKTVDFTDLYRLIVKNSISLLETRLSNRIIIYNNNNTTKMLGNLLIHYNI